MPYDNKNSFALFKNKKKQTEKHPDYRGTLTDENGREYWLSAWKNKSQAGEIYISGKLTLKEDQPKQQAPPKSEQTGVDDFIDDDIPF